jgi:hypothetical protein
MKIINLDKNKLEDSLELEFLDCIKDFYVNPKKFNEELFVKYKLLKDNDMSPLKCNNLNENFLLNDKYYNANL